MAVKATTRTTSLNVSPATDIRLFVTNLRLLDLDLCQDWPGITIQTFSAKNADQKQRIGGTEWALFHLFELWDPDETSQVGRESIQPRTPLTVPQKLQPFFPPLEPLQSLNLRAALYRCLNELKKNGVLGRETVLRKTMLDECKGDKFYEILAFFSTIVLKKVLAAQKGHGRHAAVALQVATTPSLSGDKQHSLLPLAIAHKAALVNVLRRKEAQRGKYNEFGVLLDTKATKINGRLRQCVETPRPKKPAVPQKQAEQLKKELKDNWIGNPRWLDVVLRGDDVSEEDVFLTSRFDKVWQMIENGHKVEQVEHETGLVENLQSRVLEQESRLQRWKAFHKELKEGQSNPTRSRSKVPVVAMEFKFDDHTRLQLPSTNQKDETRPIRRPSIPQQYQEILSDLDAELMNVSTSKPIRPRLGLSRKHTSSISIAEPPARSRKDAYQTSILKPQTDSVSKTTQPSLSRNYSFPNAPVFNPPRRTIVAMTPADSDATYIGYASTVTSAVPSPHPAESPFEMQHEAPHIFEASPLSSDLVADEAHPSPSIQDSSPPDQSTGSAELSPHYSPETTIPTFQISDINPEEALADQIIDSIGNATPSPVKKPQPRMSLSLIERTRLTMSRTNSFEPLPESPDHPVPSMPPPPQIPSESEVDRQATLLERTRQSMVAMQSAPGRQSLAPRQEKRKSRSSLFPVNQFDTPRTRKSFEKIEEANSVERTPTEVLLSDKVDYDRVFKSRPRIATSPIFSPAVVVGHGGEPGEGSDGEFEEEVTGIDLGDVDQSEDSDGGGGWQDSPSRRKGGTRN